MKHEEIEEYLKSRDLDAMQYQLAMDSMCYTEKAIIEKACSWLSKTLYIHTEEIEDKHWNKIETLDWVTSDYDSVSDFIDGFRKAMEE